MKGGGKSFVTDVVGTPIGFCDPYAEAPNMDDGEAETLCDDVVHLGPTWGLDSYRLWGAPPQLLKLAPLRPVDRGQKPQEVAVGVGGTNKTRTANTRMEDSFKLKDESGHGLDDRIEAWFESWCFRHRLLKDVDLDAVLYASILELGGSCNPTSLSQVLFVSGRLSGMTIFRVGARLADMRRQGLLEQADPTTLRLRSQRAARDNIRDYILRHPRKAEELGLAPKTRCNRAEATPEINLTELISRHRRLVARVTILAGHANSRIRGLSEKLLKRASSRDAMMPHRLSQLEQQLAQLEREAVGVDTPPPEPPKSYPKGSRRDSPREKDPFVTGTDLEVHLDAISLLVIQARELGGDESLDEIETGCISWLDGQPVRLTELRETKGRLRRVIYRLSTGTSAEIGEAMPAEADTAEAEAQPEDGIDWRIFPKTLKPRRAIRILRRNGFLRINGAGGHLQFEHRLTGRRYSLPTAGDSFKYRAIAISTRALLKELGRMGVEVRW